ncbi:MAG TPA: hypothetical protein ACQGQI_02605 [Xylella sp.]
MISPPGLKVAISHGFIVPPIDNDMDPMCRDTGGIDRISTVFQTHHLVCIG